MISSTLDLTLKRLESKNTSGKLGLSIDEVASVQRRCKTDPKAFELLLSHYCRYVAQFAYGYARYTKFLTVDDLFNEGVTGLRVALSKFEPSRGCAFSTYATSWIIQAIGKAIEKYDRTIRIPSYVLAIERGRKRQVVSREAELRRNLTDEYFRDMGIDPESLTLLDRLIPLSLDYPAPGTPLDLYDFTASNQESLEDLTHRKIQYECLVELMEKGLTPRECFVIKLRFGWDGMKKLSLREVGEEINLSRERVRQVERMALRKLRAMTNSDDAIRELFTQGST